MIDDMQIVDLFFARNEMAITETERKYGHLCYSIANNVLNNAQDAEECINDTYLALWNAIPPERPQNFRAFLCRIARNLSLKRLEYVSAGKRSSHCVVSLSELEETLPDSSYTDDIAEEALGELINAFLRSEKEAARRVFIRRYYFHDSIEDIAERYAFSESKVKSMLHHTRHRLKKYLTEKGVCL